MYNEDLRLDLNAWLDDISAGLSNNSFNIDEIEKAVIVINEALPKFVQDWTVAELIATIKINQALP